MCQSAALEKLEVSERLSGAPRLTLTTGYAFSIVSLYENFQWLSCKAFTGLSIRAQTVGERRPVELNFVRKHTHRCSGSERQ